MGTSKLAEWVFTPVGRQIYSRHERNFESNFMEILFYIIEL